MSRVYIDSIQICGSNKEELPFDETLKAYRVDFAPNDKGQTEELFLKVTCTLVPSGASVQTRFILDEMVPEDFKFLTGDGERITYDNVIVKPGRAVYLPFRSSNLKPIEKCLLSRLRLVVSDSADSTKRSQKTTRIKGY